MKKITSLILFAIMAVCLFTSCDDEDINAPAFAGKWTFSTIVPDVKTNNPKATEEIKKAIANDLGFYNIEFTKDGSYIEYGQDANKKATGTYARIGENLVIKLTGENKSIMYDYTISKSSLTMISDWSTEFDVNDFTAWGIDNPQSVVVEKALCQYHFSKN